MPACCQCSAGERCSRRLQAQKTVAEKGDKDQGCDVPVWGTVQLAMKARGDCGGDSQIQTGVAVAGG
jgi:hypothetical protein